MTVAVVFHSQESKKMGTTPRIPAGTVVTIDPDQEPHYRDGRTWVLLDGERLRIAFWDIQRVPCPPEPQKCSGGHRGAYIEVQGCSICTSCGCTLDMRACPHGAFVSFCPEPHDPLAEMAEQERFVRWAIQMMFPNPN